MCVALSVLTTDHTLGIRACGSTPSREEGPCCTLTAHTVFESRYRAVVMSCLRVHGVSFPRFLNDLRARGKDTHTEAVPSQSYPRDVLLTSMPALAALCLAGMLRLCLWVYGISMLRRTLLLLTGCRHGRWA